MKVEEFDHGSVEREVLVGMALDDSVCGRIAARWNKPLFASPSANIFGSLCVKFFRRHGKAPGPDSLRRAFLVWCEERRDEESVRSGERYWAVYQDDIKRSQGHLNPEHLVDVAGKLLNQVALDNLAEKIKADREAGRDDAALEAVLNFNRIELGVGAGVDGYEDMEAVDAFTAAQAEQIVVYPGGLAHFYSQTLERGRLIAFCGPEKAGKSWHLLDLAVRASEQGRRVAYFECGDMTQNELMGRFYSRITQRPVKSSNREGTWPCDVMMPSLLSPPAKAGDIAAEVDFKILPFKRPPSGKRIKAALKVVVAGWGDEVRNRLRFSFHPAGTLGVDGISSILDGWAREGWEADVIIADYADILADPPGSQKDFRHNIAKNWEMLRSLSMARHALVVTATQANREAYDKPFPLNRKNISEDKRKLAYVSAIVGINVVPAEKKNDQCRLNWVANRGKQTSWTDVVHVAGCLSLANPCVLSIFP